MEGNFYTNLISCYTPEILGKYRSTTTKVLSSSGAVDEHHKLKFSEPKIVPAGKGSKLPAALDGFTDESRERLCFDLKVRVTGEIVNDKEEIEIQSTAMRHRVTDASWFKDHSIDDELSGKEFTVRIDVSAKKLRRKAQKVFLNHDMEDEDLDGCGVPGVQSKLEDNEGDIDTYLEYYSLMALLLDSESDDEENPDEYDIYCGSIYNKELPDDKRIETYVDMLKIMDERIRALYNAVPAETFGQALFYRIVSNRFDTAPCPEGFYEIELPGSPGTWVPVDDLDDGGWW